MFSSKTWKYSLFFFVFRKFLNFVYFQIKPKKNLKNLWILIAFFVWYSSMKLIEFSFSCSSKKVISLSNLKIYLWIKTSFHFLGLYWLSLMICTMIFCNFFPKVPTFFDNFLNSYVKLFFLALNFPYCLYKKTFHLIFHFPLVVLFQNSDVLPKAFWL